MGHARTLAEATRVLVGMQLGSEGLPSAISTKKKKNAPIVYATPSVFTPLHNGRFNPFPVYGDVRNARFQRSVCNIAYSNHQQNWGRPVPGKSEEGTRPDVFFSFSDFFRLGGGIVWVRGVGGILRRSMEFRGRTVPIQMKSNLSAAAAILEVKKVNETVGWKTNATSTDRPQAWPWLGLG